MQTFKSKIDKRIWIPLGLLLTAATLLLVMTKQWAGVVMVVGAIALIIHLLVSTSYTIAGSKLIVACGILVKKEININAIKKVVHTSNPLASPALSLRRLALHYNRYDTIMISPEKESAFLEQLKKLNAEIDIQ